MFPPAACCAVLALAGLAAPARAETRNWTNAAGGAFEDAANWSGGVPTFRDAAAFDLSGMAPYTVRLGGDASILGMDVGNDNVAFDLGGHRLTSGKSAPVRLGFADGQNATVRIGGGTLTTLQNSILAGPAGSSAAVTLNGAGTQWTGNITVGDAGNATLEVSGGAAVSGIGVVAKTVGSRGAVTVTGPGSRWDAGQTIYLVGTGAQGARASLSVLDGGLVSHIGSTFLVGGGRGGEAHVVVSGVNGATRSTFRAVSSVAVGAAGAGSLAVENGALGDFRYLTIDDGAGAGGEVTVGGAAGGTPAEVVVGGALDIARHASTGSGAARLTVNAGGAVRVTNAVSVGNDARSVGSLDVSGGDLSAPGVSVFSGKGSLSAGTLTGGVVRVLAPTATALAAFTQTGGLLTGTPTATGAPRATFLTVGNSVQSGSYDFRGGRAFANVSVGKTGILAFTGGTIDGTVGNGGMFFVGPPPAPTPAGMVAAAAATMPTVTGLFTNSPGGTVRVVGADVRFAGDFLDNGTFSAWGGRSHFTSFRPGTNGIVAAGGGAEFDVTGEFRNDSTRPAEWDTSGAILHFSGNGPLTSIVNFLWVNGADKGAVVGGYDRNFAWGALHLDEGDPLTLQSPTTGHAFYVRELLLDGGVAQLRSIHGASTGANIYYDATAPANAYLLGQRYTLNGGGAIIPVVPEPTAAAVLLLPAAWALSRRRGAWHGRPAATHPCSQLEWCRRWVRLFGSPLHNSPGTIRCMTAHRVGRVFGLQP